MRSWIAVVAAVSLASCRFDDSVPADAVISCSSNEQCPSGWKCSVLRSICQQRDESDTFAPELTGTVVPALVRPGERVTVTLESNEPLSGDAVVEVSARSTLRRVERAPDDTFTFEVPGDEADGFLIFYATAEDRAGNGARGVRLGTSVVDGTAPQVMSVRVSPERVAPGQAAVATVSLNEEVRAGATLEVTTAAGPLLLQRVSTLPSSLLRFEFVVPVGTVDQTLALRVAGLVDVAGNLGLESTASLEVDGTPPVIGTVGLNGRRYSAMPNFNVVQVPVSVSGAASISACLDQDCRSATDG